MLWRAKHSFSTELKVSRPICIRLIFDPKYHPFSAKKGPASLKDYILFALLILDEKIQLLDHITGLVVILQNNYGPKRERFNMTVMLSARNFHAVEKGSGGEYSVNKSIVTRNRLRTANLTLSMVCKNPAERMIGTKVRIFLFFGRKKSSETFNHASVFLDQCDVFRKISG